MLPHLNSFSVSQRPSCVRLWPGRAMQMHINGHLPDASINTAISIIYFKCVKPILIYIGGMVIINKI